MHFLKSDNFPMYCGYLSLDITIFEWEYSHVLSTVENSAVMRTCPALGPRHQLGTPENLQKWQLSHEFSTERHKNVVYYGKIFCYMRICPWPSPPGWHPRGFAQPVNITILHLQLQLQIHHITITITTLQVTSLAPLRFCTTRQHYEHTLLLEH